MTTGCSQVFDKMMKGFQKLDDSDDDKSEVPEEEILPLRITYLTPALIKEAREQLNETEEVRGKALDEMRRLIEAEPKFSSPTDDLFLLAFLRSRKFNVRKAFKLLRNYWSFRSEHKHIFDVFDYGIVKRLILRSYVGLLPHRDRKGCIVFLFKFGLWNPDEDTYEDVFRAISGILVYSLEHEASQIAGFRMIFDARGLSWTQLKYGTPANIVLFIKSTQFCFPARYKGVHILSENRMFNIIWTLVYPFLTSKLKKRIFFHGEDPKPLTEYIHPSVLPEEFGGEAPKFDNSEWPDIIESRIDSMKDMLNYGYRD